jgi:hypothetical protein
MIRSRTCRYIFERTWLEISTTLIVRQVDFFKHIYIYIYTYTHISIELLKILEREGNPTNGERF